MATLDDDAAAAAAPVDALVAKVAASVDLVAGVPRIGADALHEHAVAIAAVDDARRRATIAEELVAFAVRATSDQEGEGAPGDAFDDVVMQLAALAAVALADPRMGALLEDAGLSRERARDVIGAAPSTLTPVGAGGRVAGAKSPLTAILDARTKKR